MKKILLTLSILLISSGTHSQSKDIQYFICDGYVTEGGLPNNSGEKAKDVEKVRKVKWSTTFQRVKNANKSDRQSPVAYLTFAHEKLEVCREDEINLILVKHCDLSNVTLHKRSKHGGTMDKVTGELFYTAELEYDNIFYWKIYYLNCKRAISPVVM
jgi:hypothetical protein